MGRNCGRLQPTSKHHQLYISCSFYSHPSRDKKTPEAMRAGRQETGMQAGMRPSERPYRHPLPLCSMPAWSLDGIATGIPTAMATSYLVRSVLHLGAAAVGRPLVRLEQHLQLGHVTVLQQTLVVHTLHRHRVALFLGDFGQEPLHVVPQHTQLRVGRYGALVGQLAGPKVEFVGRRLDMCVVACDADGTVGAHGGQLGGRQRHEHMITERQIHKYGGLLNHVFLDALIAPLHRTAIPTQRAERRGVVHGEVEHPQHVALDGLEGGHGGWLVAVVKDDVLLACKAALEALALLVDIVDAVVVHVGQTQTHDTRHQVLVSGEGFDALAGHELLLVPPIHITVHHIDGRGDAVLAKRQVVLTPIVVILILIFIVDTRRDVVPAHKPVPQPGAQGRQLDVAAAVTTAIASQELLAVGGEEVAVWQGESAVLVVFDSPEVLWSVVVRSVESGRRLPPLHVRGVLVHLQTQHTLEEGVPQGSGTRDALRGVHLEQAFQ
mmetsp:Transcript_37983/g.108456  ORF Transcript_37983/g.108456 Transcript_37983/m.108456 type:complete len:493 (+) Transcript_37983:26-1504(+)